MDFLLLTTIKKSSLSKLTKSVTQLSKNKGEADNEFDVVEFETSEVDYF